MGEAVTHTVICSRRTAPGIRISKLDRNVTLCMHHQYSLKWGWREGVENMVARHEIEGCSRQKIIKGA